MSRWVCLMYHDVIERADPAAGDAEFFAVTHAVFARHLDTLREMGCRGCTVEEMVATPDTGARRVAISFDDGNTGQMERAVPALVARGMTATFFVTTGWVGRPGYISWDGLREMKAAGMSIQSHTRSHPFLSELDAAALRAELTGSREDLDAQLNQQTTSLALPGGDAPRPALRGALADAGYRIVATSRWGTNGAASRGAWLNRCTVQGEMSAATFRRVVEADRALALRRFVRERALHALRVTLGPTRYSRWRRRWLDRVLGAGKVA